MPYSLTRARLFMKMLCQVRLVIVVRYHLSPADYKLISERAGYYSKNSSKFDFAGYLFSLAS